ncbi:TolB family protein [Roseivirga sp. 4D4]|uniref:TolB family protein n=1 Tax=Roseivirga sp. 4D4 TaxID=1889784 RepID=UPI00147C28B6|nr:PD40 domain-containing protein [Roseivirga sp. 4D4]
MRQFLLLGFLFFTMACDNSRSGEVESLVYLSSRDGNFDLYGIDPLGQWEKRLTTNEGWDWQPKWINGLNKLVYYTNDKERNFSVVAYSFDTDQVDSLPNSDLLNFQLTPDGKRIVYTEKEGDYQNIWMCKLDGSERIQLTNSQSYSGRFSISPNGEKLLFISDRSGSNELYLLNIESKELQRLTNNDLVEKYNTWSPDGTKVAFTMRTNEEGSKEDIYILDLGTLDITRLTDTPYSEQEIAWSLGGDKIAFHGTTDAGDHIFTIDLADGKFTKITSGDAYHGEPAWVPIEL